MSIRKIVVICLFVAFSAYIWWSWNLTIVEAQSGTVVWSEPVQLSPLGIEAWAPALATDMAGNLHVMWSQTMTGDLSRGMAGDTLFYTRWDGQEWTPVVDVLVSPNGGAAEHPELVVTPDGILHAVWGTGGRSSKLMYAQSPACCADNLQNWSEPVSLGSPVNLTSALIADQQGRLHAAFPSLETKGIVYRRSDDGGATWPVWVDIPGGVRLEDEFAGYVRLAMDGRGRVHAVWTVLPWPGRFVMYARSDDGGDTWNEPAIVDSPERKGYNPNYAPIFIDVEAYGEDELHLIWDGAPTVERNHVWSADGGNTWSQPSLLIPEITNAGRSGWNDMVVDSAGTLHAVALGLPWHASWTGEGWSPSTDIGHADGKAEWIRTALGLGNRLHVAWVMLGGGDYHHTVWYVEGKTSASPIAAQPLPTVTLSSPPTPAPTSVVVEPTVAVSSITTSITLTEETQPNVDGKTLSTFSPELFLIGVVPALLIIGVVLMLRVRAMR